MRSERKQGERKQGMIRLFLFLKSEGGLKCLLGIEQKKSKAKKKKSLDYGRKKEK